MPSYRIDVPGVGSYKVDSPSELSDQQAYAAVQQQIQSDQLRQKEHLKKTGFGAATSAGFSESLGSAEQYLGERFSSDYLKRAGQENLAKAQQKFEPTTAEDVEAAQGFFPTASRMLSKEITEPLGGIVGGYGAPIAAGVGAGLAATALAPASLVGTGIGASLLGGATTTALTAPSEIGRNIQAQRAADPKAEINYGTAEATGLVQAAIAGFGMPGTRLINKLGPRLIPEAQKLVPRIAAGEITEEAALKALSGRAATYAKAMGVNTVAGTGMMVGIEDLRRAQAGQDLMGLEEMGESAKTAALLSPIFGALHPSGRGKAEEQIRAAGADRELEVQRAKDAKSESLYGGTEYEVNLANEERAADLEGQRTVNEFYDPIREAAAKNQLVVDRRLERLKQERPDLDAAHVYAMTDTVEGTKHLMANIDDYMVFKTESEKKSFKTDLQKHLKSLKQKETAETKLSPEEKQMAAHFDALDELAVKTSDELLNYPLERLEVKRQQLDEQIADRKTPKQKIPVYDRAAQLLDDAIANHKESTRKLADTEMSKVLELKRAEEARIQEERRGQNETDAEAFERQRKLEALATPESREAYLAEQAAKEAEAQRVAEEQDKAYTETFGKDEVTPEQLAELDAANTVASKRGRLPNPPEDMNPNIDQREVDRLRAKEEQAKEASKVTEPPVEEALPVVQQSPKTVAKRAAKKVQQEVEPEKTIETEDEATAAKLDEAVKAVKSDLIKLAARLSREKVELPYELEEHLIELHDNEPTNSKDFDDYRIQVEDAIKDATTHADVARLSSAVDRAEKAAKGKGGKEVDIPEIEATDRAEVGDQNFNLDQPDIFESKNRRTKQVDGEEAPKGRTRTEPSKEPSTVEAVTKMATEWFNPVWLKRALKNGMLKVIDGDIKNTDLPDAIKNSYDNSKALYFAKDGSIYMFTKNMPLGSELGVFLHEIGEHRGLDGLIGKDRVVLLANRIRQMATGERGDAEIAKRALDMVKGMEGERANKELIAYFTEIAVNEYGIRPGMKDKPGFGGAITWINQLWQSISKALEKLHLKPEKVNAKDIVNIVYGAARLEMGREGEMGPRRAATEPMQSKAAPQLTSAEEASLKARGLTVFKTPVEPTIKQKLATRASGWRDLVDSFGVGVVGPLYSAHRKATNYYGSDSFYTKTTNKIRGTLLAHHALNAMNFVIPSMRDGSLTIDSRGYFHRVIDKNANIPLLSERWKDIHKAMKADGISDAMADQYMKTMVFADRYKILKDKRMKTPAEFTDASYAFGKQLQAKYATEYKTWRDMYNRIRNNKRDGLIKSGLMTAKRADELLDAAEYLPLYRIYESEGMDGAFLQNFSSARREQKLKFGTEDFDIGDPMENIIKNEMWMYQRIIKNHTAVRLAEEFEEVGMGRYVKSAQAKDTNVFAFNKDGETKYFQIDNANDAAIFMSAPAVTSSAIKFMRMFSGAVRRGVTITPSFAYRQMWDDVQRTWMQSGGERSFLGTLKTSAGEQLKNLRSDSPRARELESHGVVGQVDIQDGFNRMMDHLLGRADDTLLGRLESKLEKAERIARNSDMAARLSVYDSVIAQAEKQGRTDMDVVKKEAALRAQMMINFNHKGTSATARTLLAMVPFINARIQSDWRLMDALKGNIPGVSKDKAHKLLAMKVGKFAAFTALYAMARGGDDDYENATEETRNRNFLINVGGVPFKVPVAPEYALLKGSSEHLYRTLSDNEFEDGAKFRHAVATGVGNLLVTPTDVMPSALRPLLENLTNHSFFNDRELVSPTLAQRDVNKQYVSGQTSEFAKYISDIGQGLFGNTFNVSPIKIDNFFRGYLGTLGSDAMATTSLIGGWASGTERPELKLNQIPEVGALFYDDAGGQRKADFYDLRRKVEASHLTYLSLQKEGKFKEANEYRKEHAKEIAMSSSVNAIGKRLTDLRARRNAIMESERLDGEAKRVALDKIAVMEKQIVTNPTMRLKKRLEAED
jgi:hypothetical protein